MLTLDAPLNWTGLSGFKRTAPPPTTMTDWSSSLGCSGDKKRQQECMTINASLPIIYMNSICIFKCLDSYTLLVIYDRFRCSFSSEFKWNILSSFTAPQIVENSQDKIKLVIVPSLALCKPFNLIRGNRCTETPNKTSSYDQFKAIRTIGIAEKCK